jgi:hypothetical protein
MEGAWLRADDGRSAIARYGAAGGMQVRVQPRAVAGRMRTAERAPGGGVWTPTVLTY